MHAEAAYAAGATGAGVTVAVIDSGVNPSQPDLAGNISPASTDIDTSRGSLGGGDRHGTDVASVIASEFNGMGTVGVAYKATILGIRADAACADPQPTTPACPYEGDELASAVDYAVAHGARVINMSIAQDALSHSAEFEAALSRAVAAGTLITAAAGNAAQSDPRLPGRYAMDTRYAAAMIVVGAVDSTGTLASFSNRAGAAAQDFIVAPGQDIVTSCTSDTSCDHASGTSFASPHVAGALALLLQQFPSLSGPDAVRILLQTADDLGDPGVDPVYGRGLLDLKRAFQPIGTLSVPNSAARSTDATALYGSSLAGAFGDSVSRSSGLTTVGFDAFRRAFQLNLANGFPGARGAILPDLSRAALIRTDAELELGPGARLSFAAARPQPLPDSLADRPLLQLRQDAADMDWRLQAGRLELSVTRSQDGPLQALGPAASASTPFAALVQSRIATSAAYRFGALTLRAEAGSGARTLPFAAVRPQASSYGQATLEAGRGAWTFALTAGGLSEPEGPLGSLLPRETAFAMPAATRYVMTRVTTALPGGIGASLQAGLGETRAAGPLLSLSAPAVTSTWRASAWTTREVPGLGPTSFSLELEQPVRVESGEFATAPLALAPARPGDPLVFSTRRFSAAPSGRELDVRLSAARRGGRFGDADLELFAVHDQGNLAGAPLAVGVLAGWRAAF